MTSDLKPGMRCGNYELIAFIGKGGMAQVWSARNTLSGELVAVKTLLPMYATDSVLQERLAREGESQKALKHPNILRAQGTFRTEDSIFMVMDLVDGESLERYLLRRHTMPVPEIRGIAQAVLSALHHAHESNIVHRDVKPSNILLSRNGRILLSDFGIALLRNAVRLTRIGGIGTPCYMSPEQIVGKDIGHRSDIYALGCVLYELLTGLPPFHAEGPTANEVVREAHQFQMPEPLRQKHPEIPPALERAVLRALEKKPENRFQSCAEFAAALGVSIQLHHPGSGAAQNDPTHPLPLRRPTLDSPAEPHGPAIVTPRPGTPVDARGGQRPSRPQPRVHPPLSGAGVTVARPSRPTGRPTPAAVIKEHPRATGTIAIAAAIVLAITAIVRWEMSRPSTPADSPQVPAAASGPDKVVVAAPPSQPKPTPNAGTQDNPAGQGAGADQNPLDSTRVSNAIDQLRNTYGRLQSNPAPQPSDAQASTGPSVLANRPAPLTPPPGVTARTGVLQWTGAKGDTVEINGSGASKGALTGDALPGVPVKVWIENDDGTVVEAPSDADGYRKLTLRMASGRARIHWQTLAAGQNK